MKRLFYIFTFFLLGATPIFAQNKSIVLVDTIACPKSNINLNISNNYSSVIWSPKIDISCNNCLTPIITVNKKANYIGIANKKDGSIDTLIIKVKPFEIKVGPDRKVCLGDSFKFYPIEVLKNATYKWQPGNNISCTACANPTFNGISAGQIEYLITGNLQGCIVKDTVKVVIVPELAPLLKLTKINNVCRDSTIFIGSTFNDPNNNYVWTALGTNFTSNQSNPQVTLTQDVTFKVSVTNAKCFFPVVDSVTIKVGQPFKINLSDTSLCYGTKLPLNIEKPIKGVNYTWSPAKFFDNPNNLNSPFTATETGVYKINATNGCKVEKQININILPIPNFNIIASSSDICKGEEVKLNISKLDTSSKFKWLLPINNCINCLDQTLNLDTTTTFKVLATLKTCTIEKAIKINVKQSEQIVINPNQTTICQGSSTQLNIPLSTQNGYKWSGFGLSCKDCPNPIAKPDTTTTYTIKGKSATNGCPSFGSVLIKVDKNPKPNKNPLPDICNNSPDSVKLLINPNPNYKYTWTFGNQISNNPKLTVKPSVLTNYYLKTTSGVCEVLDTVSVGNYNAKLTISKDTLVCRGSKLTFMATVTGDQSGKFYWIPGNISGALYSIANPQTSTTYQVRYDFNGRCPQYKNVTAKVKNDSIYLSIFPNTDFYLFPEGKIFQITADATPSNGFKTINWFELRSKPGDDTKFDTTFLSKELFSKLSVTPKCYWDGSKRINAKYKYLASALFNDGCKITSVSPELFPDCTVVKYPLAFAPESSEINNRVFTAYFNGDNNIKIEKISIYNRFGQLVYSGIEPWNGYSNNNSAEEIVPSDVYMYKIQIRYADDFIETKNGDITVLR